MNTDTCRGRERESVSVLCVHVRDRDRERERESESRESLTSKYLWLVKSFNLTPSRTWFLLQAEHLLHGLLYITFTDQQQREINRVSLGS